jgi:hypothetical protein
MRCCRALSKLIHDNAPRVIPACFAHACRQAPGEPGYGKAGIQLSDWRSMLQRDLDARYARRASAALQRARREHLGMTELLRRKALATHAAQCSRDGDALIAGSDFEHITCGADMRR